MTTSERPPEDFDLYRDGKWGRPFTITRKSSGEVDEYAANTVWTVDNDGTFHVYGTIDQEEYVPEDEGTRGRMDIFGFEPFAHYAAGDWEQTFIPRE